MKKILVAFLFISLFAIYTVLQTVQKPVSQEAIDTIKTLKTSPCGDGPSRDAVLAESSMSEIRKLGEYELTCKTQVTNQLYYKVTMPKTIDTSNVTANKLAANIAEFAKYEIKPIIILDTQDGWTQQDFTAAAAGQFDTVTDNLFKQLLALGVKDTDINAIVVYPNANLPLWNGLNILPETYMAATNRTTNIIAKYYKEVRVGLMFNTQTFDAAGFSWSEGEYVSLVKYLTAINKGSIKLLVLEGFPWVPSAGGKGEDLLNPAEYINTKLITEALDNLNIKDVVINTGTFVAKYTDDSIQTVTVPAYIRQQILNQTLDVITRIRALGYNPTLGIVDFVDPKAEKTDWSYWGTDNTQSGEHALVIAQFLREVYKKTIPVTLKFN